MEKFNKLTGNAIPIRITNVDTDMIIPKQFLKTIKRTGLGEYLFFELKVVALHGNMPLGQLLTMVLNV